MDPKLLEILKKAKQIDKAAQKYDSSAPKKSQTSGLNEMSGRMSSEDMGYGMNESTSNVDVNSESYNQAVKKSGLPAAIQRAMLENPIPKSDGVYGVDEDSIRQLREMDYDENDEVDMYEKPVRRAETKRKPINEEVSLNPVKIDESYLRKLINSEITKALPKIIEHYFDSRLVKENVQFKAGSTVFSGSVMPMPKVKKNNV